MDITHLPHDVIAALAKAHLETVNRAADKIEGLNALHASTGLTHAVDLLARKPDPLAWSLVELVQFRQAITSQSRKASATKPFDTTIADEIPF